MKGKMYAFYVYKLSIFILIFNYSEYERKRIWTRRWFFYEVK